MGPHPTPRTLKLGAVVDVTHSVSMVALTVRGTGRRRLTAGNAATATAFAIAEWLRASSLGRGAAPPMGSREGHGHATVG
jgi:hypothetical protein